MTKRVSIETIRTNNDKTLRVAPRVLEDYGRHLVRVAKPCPCCGSSNQARMHKTDLDGFGDLTRDERRAGDLLIECGRCQAADEAAEYADGI